MKRKSSVILFCSLVGAAIGAAIAYTAPMWPIFYGDVLETDPLWAALEPGFRVWRRYDEYYIPVAISIVIIGVCLFYGRKYGKGLDRKARNRRIFRGCCEACSYNLKGNTSGVCPECGAPITEAR